MNGLTLKVNGDNNLNTKLVWIMVTKVLPVLEIKLPFSNNKKMLGLLWTVGFSKDFHRSTVHKRKISYLIIWLAQSTTQIL
jgi:hypothetical protein